MPILYMIPLSHFGIFDLFKAVALKLLSEGILALKNIGLQELNIFFYHKLILY